jgi:hypothetical protein
MPKLVSNISAAEPRDLQHAHGATEAKVVLAHQVPGGFAGVYLTRAGQSVVLLTDTSQQRNALPVLDSLLTRIYRRSLHVRNAEVHAANWNFADLYAWQRYFAETLLGSDVPTIAIDEAKNRVVVGAKDAKIRDGLVARLNELGLPCNLGTFSVNGPPAITSGSTF